MSPETAAWLADLRAEAAAPGALLVAVPGKAGTLPIYPNDIVGKSDDELLAYVRERVGSP
ncbi:hypothetical protein [Massilia sp. DD77]|uniref:hypothetical protein n=1 Tax=Massilia sp. DD77 TaxID=3109349 RepID=UPI002FFFE1E0